MIEHYLVKCSILHTIHVPVVRLTEGGGCPETRPAADGRLAGHWPIEIFAVRRRQKVVYHSRPI